MDIWHCRKIKYLCAPIRIVDFFAPLKGKLLGPRGTIWQLRDAHGTLKELSSGTLAHDLLASDPELREAFERLRDLIVRRTQNLDDKGWEWLVAITSDLSMPTWTSELEEPGPSSTLKQYSITANWARLCGTFRSSDIRMRQWKDPI